MNGRLLVGACLLFALLGGCTSTAPAPEEAAQENPPSPEGMTTTLIRVVPKGHAIDWSSYQVTKACAPDGSEPCRDTIVQVAGATVGTTSEQPEWSVDDPEALFWRVDARVEWETDNPSVSEAKLELFTRKPCGAGCWEERLVDERTGASPLAIERRDVYLEEGETGVLFRLTSLSGSLPTPGSGVHFHTVGHADGYVPAGDPPIVVGAGPS